MKSPLTRRRERRILAALQVFGELNEWEIAEFTGVSRVFLRVPLFNLARTRQITGTKIGSLSGGYFVWSIRGQEDNVHG